MVPGKLAALTLATSDLGNAVLRAWPVVKGSSHAVMMDSIRRIITLHDEEHAPGGAV